MLITDMQTDKILFINDKKFKNTINQFKSQDDIITLIENKNLDSWIRDYSYLQLDDKFIRFTFNPTYMPEYMAKSIQEEFNALYPHSIHLNIRLDGGNIIHNGKIAICTDKLFKLNRHFDELFIKKLLIETLELEDMYVVPSMKYEKTGHIDGMAQFITNDILLIDNDATEYCSILKTIPGIDTYILESYKPYDVKISNWVSAQGLYINFLQTKNTIYVPEFKQEDDEKMFKFFSGFNKPVQMVECSDIYPYGGGLHCLSWNYK